MFFQILKISKPTNATLLAKIVTVIAAYITYLVKKFVVYSFEVDDDLKEIRFFKQTLLLLLLNKKQTKINIMDLLLECIVV